MAGCTQNSSLGVVGRSVDLVLYGHPDANFNREYIESIQYESMILKIGDGPKSLVVLYKTVGDDMHWIAADYTLYITRHGRLVKTANLPINRVGLEARQADPIQRIQQGLEFNSSMYYEVDLQPGNFFATPFHSTFEYDGEEEIHILDRTYQTKRYIERFESKKLYWEGKNVFWFDADSGVLRQTLQYSDPKTPAFLTQNVR